VVAGGQTNYIYDWSAYSAIAGGKDNRIGAYSFASAVLGGSDNRVYGSSSTIAGGSGNVILSTYAFIGGGTANVVSGQNSVVGGGASNNLFGSFASIGGGQFHTVDAMYATVAGGQENKIQAGASHAVIAGGYRNYTNGAYAFVGGGGPNGGVTGNIVDGAYSSIVGGSSNTINSVAALGFIGGGSDNHIYGDASVIGGGSRNAAGVGGSKYYAAVLGGHDNQALGEAAFVGGGSGNAIRAGATAAVIGGGQDNQVNLPYGVIPGGLRNAASGDYSFAAGYQSTAAANGTFSWKDSQPDSIVNNLTDQVMFKAAGGFWVSTSTNYGLPALYVTPGNNVSLGITGSAQSRLTIVEPYPQAFSGNQYLVRVGTGAIPAMLSVSTSGVVGMSMQSVSIASAPPMALAGTGWNPINSFNFEEIDTQNEMTTVGFTTRNSGRYLVTFDATMQCAIANNTVGVGVGVNGEAVPTRYTTSYVGATGQNAVSFSHVFNLNAGSLLQFYFYNTLASAFNNFVPMVTVTKLN
jgi:hypothetical protein